MAYSSSDLQTALDNFVDNLNSKLDVIINGDASTDVTVDSGTVPSIAKLQNQMQGSLTATNFVFSGNSILTSFTCTGANIASVTSILVAVDGDWVAPADYSISGVDTVVFSSAPATGTNNIQIRVLGVGIVGTTSNSDSVSYTLPGAAGAAATDLEAKSTERISVQDFGALGNGTTDDSTAIQAAIDHCKTLTGGTVYFPAGTYKINTQIDLSVTGASGSCRVNLIGDKGATIKSNITGATDGYNTAGFAIVADGWRDSKIEGLTFDHTLQAGSEFGSIAIRCRKQSAVHNRIVDCYFVGNAAGTIPSWGTGDPETVAVKMVGNEASAASTGYACYWNQMRGCVFNIFRDSVRLVEGDGSVSTKECNAHQFYQCHFERYIVALNLDTADEIIVMGGWWNAAQGQAGIEGGFTYAVKLDSTFCYIQGIAEPGTDSKVANILSAATGNTINVIDNTGSSNTIDPLAANNNTIINRDKYDGMAELNWTGTTAGSAGAVAGYIEMEVNGTTYKVPYHATS